MSNETLKCSLDECKARLKEIDFMNLSELEEYATKCATCGNWIHKETTIAEETYTKVSLKWAEEFNKALLTQERN